MLRPGLSLYGYAPRLTDTWRESGETVVPDDLEMPKLSPVLEWKTRVASLRSIDIGDSAGYNSTFRAYRPTRLALLPLGYADGLSRLFSNRGRCWCAANAHRSPEGSRWTRPFSTSPTSPGSRSAMKQ